MILITIVVVAIIIIIVSALKVFDLLKENCWHSNIRALRTRVENLGLATIATINFPAI